MNKSTHFSGHPIIKQLLQFIDPGLINRTAQAWQADRYYKRFKTYDHLVTMLFVALSGVSSLRELSSVMLACEGKINHLNMRHFPRRSTISDANAKRESGVFAEIYHRLLNRYRRFLSDSSPRKPAVKELRIIDSTTISLFTDILKGPPPPPYNQYLNFPNFPLLTPHITLSKLTSNSFFFPTPYPFSVFRDSPKRQCRLAVSRRIRDC